MIRWLSKDEWKNYVEERTKIGKYISHMVLRDREIHKPEDKYNFSDAIVKVKVNQKENEFDDDDIIDMYFDNAGPIKIEGDTHEVDDESAEFQFLFNHPYVIDHIIEFIKMMSEKFGSTYRTRRLLHANFEKDLARDELKMINDEMLNFEFLHGKVRTSTKSIIDDELLLSKPKQLYKFSGKLCPQKFPYKFHSLSENAKTMPYSKSGIQIETPKTQLDEIIDTTIKKDYSDLLDEKEYIEDYIYYQDGLIYFIADLEASTTGFKSVIENQI